jgi:starch phosphorylase
LRGAGGHEVPVYLLDTDLEDNAPEDRALTGQLYGGDARYRLAQEMVLGLAGAAMLDMLHPRVRTHHMNEGHAALVPLALLARGLSLDEVRQRCVFTTHTPVPAGHEHFAPELAHALLGGELLERLRSAGLWQGSSLDMTRLALGASRYANAVSLRHGQVSRELFGDPRIDAITNGVHAATWAAPPMRELFTRRIPGWSSDHDRLRQASTVEPGELSSAHLDAKRALLAAVARQTGVTLDERALLLGFARRATQYKRAHLLLSEPERLRQIARRAGPLHILYAGKAHPRDGGGRDLIRSVVARAAELRGDLSIVYLEGYDLEWAKLLCAGCDLWVNTPEPPLEASGTSGMKAAVNGVPSLSTLDGWWVEGHVEGVTGWSLDARGGDLYDKLEQIASLFHRDQAAWARIMRHTIALNASYFNTHRMMRHYAASAYGLLP